MKIDILTLLPKNELIKRKMEACPRGDSFIIKYYNLRKIKISRYISRDHDLGIFVGLVLTEALQSKKIGSRNSFILMNTDPDVIKICIHLLKKKFGIGLDTFKFSLYVPPSMKNDFDKIETKWREELHINKKFNIKRYIQVDLKKPKFAFFIYRSAFRFVIDNIIEKTLKHINKKEFGKGFLAGVFVAEGSVEIKKNGSLKSIYISQCNDENRQLIKKTLSFYGIKFKERLNPHSKDIRITNLKNFEIINKLNICSISKIKKKRFIEGLINLRKDPHAGRSVEQTKKEILDILRKDSPLTIDKISKELNMSYYTIWDHIFRKKTEKRKCYDGLFHQGLIKFKSNTIKDKVGRAGRLFSLKKVKNE